MIRDTYRRSLLWVLLFALFQPVIHGQMIGICLADRAGQPERTLFLDQNSQQLAEFSAEWTIIWPPTQGRIQTFSGFPLKVEHRSTPLNGQVLTGNPLQEELIQALRKSLPGTEIIF